MHKHKHWYHTCGCAWINHSHFGVNRLGDVVVPCDTFPNDDFRIPSSNQAQLAGKKQTTIIYRWLSHSNKFTDNQNSNLFCVFCAGFSSHVSPGISTVGCFFFRTYNAGPTDLLASRVNASRLGGNATHAAETATWRGIADRSWPKVG
jgi:hypothetical protein